MVPGPAGPRKGAAKRTEKQDNMRLLCVAIAIVSAAFFLTIIGKSSVQVEVPECDIPAASPKTSASVSIFQCFFFKIFQEEVHFTVIDLRFFPIFYFSRATVRISRRNFPASALSANRYNE